MYEHCIAAANSPYALIRKGLEEYIVGYEIDSKKLILGLPWYAYEYPCEEYTNTVDLCIISQVSAMIAAFYVSHDNFIALRFLSMDRHVVILLELKRTMVRSCEERMLILQTLLFIGMILPNHLSIFMRMRRLLPRKVKSGLIVRKVCG